ncbi:SDR family oxidoreductase [Rhodohalobacter sulfatireducens]|uniref:SDR family oxidoreductase n=1 Tax=Rhodohalobacter sulfatireducens TaxID=2911366 RepID=A0ABS9KD16_9BACT|nr:SDR family oxidoreductase [Rhodohalobacter sulfatireducens]MCG2588749.1 SDR family oxidoreductase [Rhodohalobacter sulfatireducens]
MNDRWLLILGANSDIAVETAHQFAKNSWNLLLASRDISNLNKVASDIEIKHQVRVKTFEFDASDFKSHNSFYENLPYKPDGVILAFGYLGDQQRAQKNFGEAKKTLDTNFTGAVSILEIIAEDFTERKTGFIVGISSVAGERGRQENYIYGSSKAGFSAYLSGLRQRLYKVDIHVMTVKPGFVRTKMTLNRDLPGMITADPKDVGIAIYKGILKKRNIIYVYPVWRLIMFIVKSIPETIFRRLDI